MRRGAQGDAGEILAELFADAQVHLVVHQPQRDLGDLGGELLDLDAVKLIDIDAQQRMHIHTQLPAGVGFLGAGTQNGQFQLAQLAVADDQKIAAAARGVKKRQTAQLFVELKQAVAGCFLTFSNSAHSSSKNSGLMSLRMFSSLV